MTCDTLGLYARSVADLQLLASVFKLADDEPVPSSPFKIEGAKIAFVKTHVWPKAGPGTKQAWEKAKALLEGKGAKVEEVELPDDFQKIKDWHARVLAGEGMTSFLGSIHYLQLIPIGHTCVAKRVLLTNDADYLLAKDKMHTMLHGHVENSSKLSRKAQLEAYDGCAKLRPVWDEIAGNYDAVFTPSVVDEAPVGIERTGDAVSLPFFRAWWTNFRNPANMCQSFCSMWTILQCPALNVPGFAGDNGLPVGLTLVGARYTDEHVLHAAKTIGEVFEKEGGFVSKLL